MMPSCSKQDLVEALEIISSIKAENLFASLARLFGTIQLMDSEELVANWQAIRTFELVLESRGETISSQAHRVILEQIELAIRERAKFKLSPERVKDVFK